MILNLSELSDEPLHAQISRQIRARILAHELTDEAPLPSIRVMARQQKVSVITVKRAYEDLEREGLIRSRRGSRIRRRWGCGETPRPDRSCPSSRNGPSSGSASRRIARW